MPVPLNASSTSGGRLREFARGRLPVRMEGGAVPGWVGTWHQVRWARSPGRTAVRVGVRVSLPSSIQALALAGLVGLAGCWGERAFILEGQVLEQLDADTIVVDHDPVQGLMPAMVMPFDVSEAGILDGVRPGARIVARLMKEDGKVVIDKLRVTGHAPLPPSYRQPEGGPVRPGKTLPATAIDVGDGPWTVGEGQGVPTVLTFLYTTCPLPAFCPMVTSRLQGLQGSLSADDDARLIAVTIDPSTDTRTVLDAYAQTAGADPARWRFGRLEGEALEALVGHAALSVVREGEIVHAIRWLVLDAEGRLIERYDDNGWPMDRVLSQLRTGAPTAPPGSDGTRTPDHEVPGPG